MGHGASVCAGRLCKAIREGACTKRSVLCQPLIRVNYSSETPLRCSKIYSSMSGAAPGSWSCMAWCLALWMREVCTQTAEKAPRVLLQHVTLCAAYRLSHVAHVRAHTCEVVSLDGEMIEPPVWSSLTATVPAAWYLLRPRKRTSITWLYQSFLARGSSPTLARCARPRQPIKHTVWCHLSHSV